MQVFDTYGNFERRMVALDAPVAIIRYMDTYGDFEQTVMNNIAVIRYWIPMVNLNRQS